jgi:dTDP-4-dehydrorhamnose 3,5-epimerase
MRFSKIPFSGAWLVETEPFQDHRGKFVRFFCQNELRDIHNGRPIDQISYSLTVKKGTIRGIHYQFPPNAEIKLIRCLNGSVFDVIVDLRQNSPTFLKWHGEILSRENMKMLYVPQGIAHGFQTLEENCEMLYLHSGFYSPSQQAGLRFDDPKIGIQWPLEVTEISERDLNFSPLTSGFSGVIL